MKFFNSPVKVKPRIEKTYKDKVIRQHHALLHLDNNSNKWLDVEVGILSKLVTLVINKFLLLDSDNLGIMYEANKPGWNDALNGLPGIFGSGIGEMIELLSLTKYVSEVLGKYNISFHVIKPLKELIYEMNKVNLKDFNSRVTLVETYREKLDNITLDSVNLEELNVVLNKMLLILEESFNNVKKEPIIPTYRSFEVTKYKETNKETNLGKLVMPFSIKEHILVLS